jgi:hypothetical protein
MAIKKFILLLVVLFISLSSFVCAYTWFSSVGDTPDFMYALNSTSGTTAVDDMGAQNGIATAASWKAGFMNNSFWFGSEYIALGTDTAMGMSVAQTSFCFWAYTNTTVGARRAIDLGARMSIGMNDIEDATCLNNCANYSAYWYTTPGNKCLCSDITPVANSWAHICFTFDETNNEQKMYVNGSLRRTTTDTNDLLDDPPRSIDLGYSSITSSYRWWGMLDDVAIWKNYIVTAADVQTIYNSYVVTDFTPPSVQIGTNNTTPQYNTNISINVNSSEKGNCWVYNNMSNTNSSSIACNATFTYKINLTKSNSIFFRAYATDVALNLNSTETLTVNVANSLPPITNNFNVSNDYTASTNETINFTAVTDADGDTVNYYVWWNDSTVRRIANTTLNKFTLNLTTEGVFYYWVETFDGTASGGNSSIQKITADFTPPTITWYSPTAATTYTLNTNYLINVTCSDNYEIWSMNISQYNSTGNNIRSIGIENVSYASYNNASLWDLALYQKNIISVRCYDSHTAELIPNLQKSKLNDTLLVFNDLKKNEYLNIEPSMISSIDKAIVLSKDFVSSMDYIDEYDRVTIDTAKATKIKLSNNFKIENKGDKIIYHMTGNKKLNYLPHSKYAGHIVWGEYVTDFDSARYIFVNGLKTPSIIQVKIINDYNIDVIVSGLLEWQAGDVILIDPETQGLNWAEQNRTIYQMSYPYYTNLLNNASSGTYINGRINWSIEAQDRDIDGNGLNYVVFWHNSSGYLDLEIKNAGASGRNFKFFNITTTITAPHYVCAFWNITDLYGLVNQSAYSCANITNSIPTIPVLSLPANNSLQTSNTTLFDWSDSTDADSDSITYNLLVSNASDLSYVWFNKTGLTSSTYTLTNNQSLSDGQYYWAVNSTDSYSYSNYSLIFTYIINTSFGVAAQTKNCSVCYANEDILFNTTINGATLIDTVIFSENSTGAWINYTSGFINSTDWYAYQINGTNYQRFEFIGWFWWVNSTDNRISIGALQTFNISNHLPTQATPTINITNISNLILSNLTCSPNNVTDADGDTITINYVWYKNDVQQTAYNGIQKLSYENTTEDEIWLCQIDIYDGYNYGLTKNSTAKEIISYLPNPDYLFMYPETNYTYYINVPKYSYVSNLSFYLGAYNSTDICYQEFANQSAQCQFFSTYGTGRYLYPINHSENSNLGNDGNHDTYWNWSDMAIGMIIEYKVPNVPIILEIDTGKPEVHCRYNITIPQRFIINNTLYIDPIYLGGGFGPALVFTAWNGSWQTLYNTANMPCGAGVGNTYLLYEEAIYLNLTSSGITNLSISTYDGNNIYLNYSVWPDMQKYTINTNISVINNILKNDCSCTGCFKSDSICTIPLNFTSKSTGRLRIYYYNFSTNFELNNCAGSSIPSNATALNISFYDNAGSSDTIVYEATTFYTDGVRNKNISIASSGLNNTQYCIYPNWARMTVNQHNNYYDGTNYYNYYLNNNLFSNATQQLNLYTKNGTTQVLFTVQDKNSESVANAFLHILAYDVGSGTYQTTEILQTDTKGQALGNIVLYNMFYTFLIYSNNNLVYAENGVRVIANTRTFTISLAGTIWTDDFVISGSVSHNLYFNNATNNFVFTYSDASSTMHYGCLRVDKFNRTGSYNLSDDCLYSASGSVITNIVPSNDTTYIGTGYIKFDNHFVKDIVEVIFKKPLGYFHEKEPGLMLFLAVIIWLSLFLIGLPYPAVSLAMFSVAMVVTSLLGLYMISGTMLVGIIFLALTQIYLMNRQ